LSKQILKIDLKFGFSLFFIIPPTEQFVFGPN
jgi:hypothetical protein